MNTNLHEWFLEPRKTQKARKGNTTSWNDECPVLNADLKNNSYFITHNSELGETAWLEEIQR